MRGGPFAALRRPFSGRRAPEDERISAFDALLLAQERLSPHISSQCAWLLVFEGSPPALDDLRRRVAQRLELMPKLRSRVVYPRLRLLRPLWHVVPQVDVAEHVVTTTAAPAQDPEWLEVVDEDLAHRLDPARPLWRLTLTTPEQGRFGVVFSHHHALVDGHAALLALGALLGDVPPAVTRSDDAGARGRDGRRGRGRAVARRPLETLATLRDLFDALMVARPPRMPSLNGDLRGARRALWARLPAQEVREIAAATRSFPNEVYLATLAGGLREWLAAEGSLPERSLVAGVLVNLERKRSLDRLGNAISGTRVELPVQEPSPLRRLESVRDSSRRALRGRLVKAVQLVSSIDRVLPEPLLATSARLGAGGVAINLVTSHVVAPQPFPPVWGARLERLHSWTFLPPKQALSFVHHGIGDEVSVNVLADPDVAPDVDGLARALENAHAELLRAVRGRAEDGGDAARLSSAE